MMRSLTELGRSCGVVAVMLTAIAGTASAQGIGAGPLTASLAGAEPQSGVLRLGRFRIAPGVVVRELGWDSNVFDEPVDPKQDYVAAVAPDVSAFARLGFVQLSVYGGGDFNYYQKYDSERSAGYASRGRVDFLLSRFRPFAGGGRTRIRTRPNGEIDVRANRLEEELSGGIAYDLSDHSAVYGAAYQTKVRYLNAKEDGIDLGATLNHDRLDYSAGVRTDLTPLLQLTVSGAYQQDTFKNEPIRNGDNRYVTMQYRFAPEGLVNGLASISFRDYKPVNPETRAFRGLAATGSLSYSFLEVGRLTFIGTRGTEYSFNSVEAYYLENSFALFYTHRLFGGVDAQARAGRSIFDYAFSTRVPSHKDQLDTYGASVGYNLSNRTRISLNYEFVQRRSPVFPERNYDRKRAYLSWTFVQ